MERIGHGYQTWVRDLAAVVCHIHRDAVPSLASVDTAKDRCRWSHNDAETRHRIGNVLILEEIRTERVLEHIPPCPTTVRGSPRNVYDIGNKADSHAMERIRSIY